MPLFAMMDGLGRPAWIILMILGFMAWWPIGLAVLAFSIGSGRMGCGTHGGYDNRWQNKMERMQSKMDRMRDRMSRGGSFWEPPTSGNRAFDEYRTDTIRRLEEEQHEFRDFLARLRMAKDKAEFDQFMTDRRNRPTPPSDQPQA